MDYPSWRDGRGWALVRPRRHAWTALRADHAERASDRNGGRGRCRYGIWVAIFTNLPALSSELALSPNLGRSSVQGYSTRRSHT